VSEGLRLVLGGDKENALQNRALAALERVRRHPPYPAGRVQAMIDEANSLRKEAWEANLRSEVQTHECGECPLPGVERQELHRPPRLCGGNMQNVETSCASSR
jgi:hypothetical protein